MTARSPNVYCHVTFTFQYLLLSQQLYNTIPFRTILDFYTGIRQCRRRLHAEQMSYACTDRDRFDGSIVASQYPKISQV